MSEEYVISLPFPPSVNSYYGITCNGRVPHKYIKASGIDYRKKILKIIKKRNLQLMANIPLSVIIVITPPDHRVHDIDNILKSLFDALTHAKLWQDDSYIRELHMSYEKIQKPGSILIQIKGL